MDNNLLKLFMIFIPVLFVIGLYCIIATRNLIRTLIGLEILTKAVTLLIIVAGYLTNHMALAQAMTITLIVIEVVVIATAAALIINVFRKYESLDIRNLSSLKG